MEASGGRIVARVADVRSQEPLDAAAAAGLAEFGSIDTVLADAGVFTMASTAWEQTEEESMATIDIGFNGVRRSRKAVIPSIIESSRPCRMAMALSRPTGYNAAKLGVVALMLSLASELGQHNIGVNTVHPAVVKTMM